MNRYGCNLIHWKTLLALCPTTCYTGEEYTDDNTRLGMNLRFKEHELEKLKKKEQNPEVESNINSLKSEIKKMRQKYETEKAQLISKASYQMFPDNTLIHCQLISNDGKNIKRNGSLGSELVWCKVCDQRCFYSDILYAVKIIENNREVGSDWFSTRASLTNWPRPNWAPTSFLKDCIKDDSINAPYQGLYYPPDKFTECDVCGEKDIEPDELAIGDLNLAEIGGGYAHESCMSHEMMKEYERSLGRDVSSDESDDDCHNESCCGRGINAARMLTSTASPYVYHGEENPEEEEKKYVEDTRKKMKERLQKDGMSESDASFLTSGVSGMDKHNLKMANVIGEEGMDEAVKQMFVHPTEGRQMSYSEMRSFYG
tara:strand:- start:2405 stop:3517 length:1113 start_codon:yes stop_codon:yes gene_type:complete